MERIRIRIRLRIRVRIRVRAGKVSILLWRCMGRFYLLYLFYLGVRRAVGKQQAAQRVIR